VGRAERIWRQALERGEIARNEGHLIPLSTAVIPAGGWAPFQVRRLCSPPPRHLRAGGPKPNPFLPWDAPLEVERLGSSHVVLLNKYPVQPAHVLLITQRWAPQNGWLTLEDWEAVAAVAADTGGLWFFNSCAEAGASQPHRHLQLLPRHAGEEVCPLEGAIHDQLNGRSSRWPWAYCLSPLPDGASAAALQSLYRAHSQALALGLPAEAGRPTHPYNLLFNDRWFLTIRRIREHAAGFSVNALGFAGYLLLTERSDLHWLEEHGPWALLAAVAAPAIP
jgi:ATP adenylyltransferase